jgi:LPXTG-motif cell wall-anchored protein
MVRRLFVAATLALVALAAPAAAQQYPPAVNSFTVSDTTPNPGQTITAEARTFASGSTVTVDLSAGAPAPIAPAAGVTLTTATADGSGAVTADITIPADTALGAHTLTASGEAPDGGPLSLTVSLNVVPADGTGGGGTGNLPRTGDDSSIPLAKLGLALAALGGVITATAAKRRKASSVAA